jgi:predicted acyl esterase
MSISRQSARRRVVSGVVDGGRPEAGPVRRSSRIRAVAALATLVVCLATAASASAFTAAGSVEQVFANSLRPGVPVTLLKGRTVVQTLTADSLGSVLFRHVTPGTGYKVQQVNAKGHPKKSGKLTVHNANPAPWDPEIYNQEIPDNGYGYLTTRDGIKLAYTVHPPTQPAGQPTGKGEGGFIKLPTFPANTSYSPPYPTLIEYSGYGYANPKGPVNGIAVLANLMGFAVVDVTMRGAGCSAGAYDFFEPLQNLDGYDVIETIAKQPWVLGHKVGMMGISYGGISQLFTAQLQPPDLEAIAPLSVIDATATTLYPGGVLNDGFAVAWAEERQHEAEPASPGHGQAWADEQIKAGDKLCAENQALHPEAANLLQKIKENSTYNASVADPLDPVTFVNKITVPTYMACQFQDEQTGGHCADLVQHFTGTKEKWFTFTNGAHIDSLDPYTYTRMYDFLQLYVAHKAPAENTTPTAATKGSAAIVYKEAMGLPEGDNVLLPEDPIQTEPTYESALAAFKALPHVRVLFDNGAGKSPSGATQAAGNPYPGFEETYSEIPVPGTTAKSLYLGPGGTLTEAPPAAAGEDSYTANPEATPFNDFGSNTGGGGLWSDAAKWEWNWKPPPAGSAVSYTSAPLASDATTVGAGAIELWVKSATPDVDLQAVVSEVREDGKEEFVQNGWMRASERKLATDANNIFKQMPTQLQPIPTELASDLQSMPANEFVPVTIPLYFEGHLYRKGTRIRVTITGDNGTQPIWSFHHPQPALGSTAGESIAFSPSMPSNVVLPVTPALKATASAEPSACPELRNEPCR